MNNTMTKQLFSPLQKAKEEIMNRFAMNPNARCNVVTKVTRTILLSGPYLLRGQSRTVKAKPLGAGVYELKLEDVGVK